MSGWFHIINPPLNENFNRDIFDFNILKLDYFLLLLLLILWMLSKGEKDV